MVCIIIDVLFRLHKLQIQYVCMAMAVSTKDWLTVCWHNCSAPEEVWEIGCVFSYKWTCHKA